MPGQNFNTCIVEKYKNYLRSAGSDLPSSIVVFLVALPLCLGVALGSQAPLFSGIIAGIVGGIIVGLFSGSQLSVSGPAAGLTTIVSAAILKLPAFEAFLLAVVFLSLLSLALTNSQLQKLSHLLETQHQKLMNTRTP